MATRRIARPKAKIDAPEYKVLKTSYIDGRLVEPGASVFYEGVPGSSLRPINEKGRANWKKAQEIRGNRKLSAEDRDEKLRQLSNELLGVEEVDDFADDLEPGGDTPLSDAERVKLEAHAKAAVEATRAAEEDDTNRTTVKLSGSLNPTEAEKQGATPVTDGKKK